MTDQKDSPPQPKSTSSTASDKDATTAESTSGAGWSTRTKALVWGGVTVAVLAIVITVAAAFGPWQQEPPTDTTAIQSQLAYDRALDAERSGETTEAVELLEEAVRLDPDNTAAKAKLEELRVALAAGASGGSPSVSEQPGGTSGSSSGGSSGGGSSGGGSSGGGSSGGGDEPPSDDAFMDPVDDLTTLLPGKASGYELGTPIVLGSDATRSGTPERSGTLETNVIWTVHDLGSVKEAEAYVDRVSKSLYDKDASTVKIEGVNAYFGTDGKRFATVSWNRGRFTFELLMTSGGSPPKDLKSTAVKASEAFPDSP